MLRDSILRMYGGGKSGRYKQVEYIRRRPSYVWITNLLTISYNGELELKLQEEGDTHAGDNYVIKGTDTWITFNISNIWGRYYSSSSRSFNIVGSVPSVIILNKDSITVNNRTMSLSYDNSRTNNPIQLASGNYAIIRIYYIRYKDGDGILKHNFIPAMDKETGKFGLLDTITNTFKTSDGLGSFEGPVI